MIESKKITEFKKMKMEIENLLSDQKKLERNYELKSQNRQNANDVTEDAKIVAEEMSVITKKIINISLQMDNIKNSLNEDEKRELKQLGLLSDDKQSE
tara:strand:- start:54 stop:347 length:294 start_codon:yes stop_codon:yes gene_type:complete